MIEGVATSKYPIAFFELIPTGRSGFIREDTLRDANPIELIYPKKRVINRCSVIKEYSKEFGAEIEVKTRYVANHPEIIESKLIQQNVKFTLDSPVFVNGVLTVAKNGHTVGLYNFLTTHAQNESNPNRVERLKPLFREIKPAETAKEFNDDEFVVADAIQYIKQLITKKPEGYEYQEERIEALCSTFAIYADGVEAQIRSLIEFAKTRPSFFLSEAKKTEQIAVINVNHGLKLKLIVFEGNTAMYTDTKKGKIKSFGAGNMSDEKKIITLANFFQSVDGKELYEVYKQELSAAKSAEFKNE